jgi:hypothetical protein
MGPIAAHEQLQGEHRAWLWATNPRRKQGQGGGSRLSRDAHKESEEKVHPGAWRQVLGGEATERVEGRRVQGQSTGATTPD